MYWDIGEYVSCRVTESGWGKSMVKEFSDFIQIRYVGIKGFSPSNIWRMRQFYETYRDNEKLAPLVLELTWTHNLQIISNTRDRQKDGQTRKLEEKRPKAAAREAARTISRSVGLSRGGRDLF
jgi:hypothetical protein